jgi:hypothetical protein
MPEFENRMDDDVLIKAEHVSKKFCRSLKRSLWYGAQDVASALMPWKQSPSIPVSLAALAKRRILGRARCFF